MYKIIYTKTAVKDIPKLKSAHLDQKAKNLIELLKEDPYKRRRVVKNSSVIFRAYIPGESTISTV